MFGQMPGSPLATSTSQTPASAMRPTVGRPTTKTPKTDIGTHVVPASTPTPVGVAPVAAATPRAVPDSNFTNYMTQSRLALPQQALVTSIGIASNDDLLRTVIPISSDDPQHNIAGHSIVVRSNVQSLSIRLALGVNPFSQMVQYNGDLATTKFICTGHVSRTNAFPSIIEPLTFKVPATAAGGDVQDCVVNLLDGVNFVEIIVVAAACAAGAAVGADSPTFDEVSQTLLLTINRV
eukprot:jgi/Hompol1/5745/HPOL_004672-RA